MFESLIELVNTVNTKLLCSDLLIKRKNADASETKFEVSPDYRLLNSFEMLWNLDKQG